MRDLLGGKGANLAEMAVSDCLCRQGLPLLLKPVQTT